MAHLKKVTPEDYSKLESPGDRKHYPGFRLRLKDIPVAKRWDVGKKYRLEVEVEMTSIEERRGKSEVGFDVKAVAPIKNNPEKEYARIVKGGA